jgi:uncharacterized membrane protein
MRARLIRWLEAVRESLWAVPVTMVTGAVLLSWAMLTLDSHISPSTAASAWWIWSGSADGAREVLSTIAGSMITVASVVFSITIVALTLASSQFGPRLLGNFVRDRINQSVLGTFVATFVYCLLVLRTVYGGDHGGSIPNVAVSAGVALAIASLGVLIFFIHHIAHSIQADTLVARVASSLQQAIREAFPGDAEPETRDEEPPRLPEGDSDRVAAGEAGYVQLIDFETLVSRASEEDCVVRLLVRAGHFVVAGAPLMQVWPAGRLDDEAVERLRKTCNLGNRRTPVQDLEFSVHELVEIAVRALSPGINDPFTAVVCIDWLAAALAEAGGRRDLPIARRDEAGAVRVIASETQFEGLVRAAFDQIRQASRGNAAVSIRMLEGLRQIASRAKRPQDREALRRQANLVHESMDALPWASDRADVEDRYRAVVDALGAERGRVVVR